MCDSCETHHFLKWLFTVQLWSTGGWRHPTMFIFLFMSMFYLFSFKFFSEMGSGGQCRFVGFQNKSLWVEYFKIKCSPLQYNIWVWQMPLDPILGRHICGREGVWKLCVLIWLPFAFLGGTVTIENLMSGQTGVCAACTLSTQYQDLKGVFVVNRWVAPKLSGMNSWPVKPSSTQSCLVKGSTISLAGRVAVWKDFPRPNSLLNSSNISMPGASSHRPT